jgi:hypothetical protein
MSDTSSIWLEEVATGALVPAELLNPITDQQIIDWQRLWRPERDARINKLKHAGVPLADWPQSWHWEWDQKFHKVKSLLSHTSVGITCNGQTQGLMSLDFVTNRGRLPEQIKLELAYVDYLEVAPWNWKDNRFDPPRYNFIGYTMIRAAIEISFSQGFKGRVGLHSLPQSIKFYENCGFVNMGDDSTYHSLPYFELMTNEANAFLKRGAKS